MALLPLETAPRAGAVVWSRFPYAERPGRPALDPHPALVFSSHEYRPGQIAVQVAYGTSKLKSDTRPDDFRITNFRGMQYAGLYQATRFDLDMVKFLMWDDQWFFSPNPDVYATPVIGHLLPNDIARLQTLLRRREAKGLRNPRRQGEIGV